MAREVAKTNWDMEADVVIIGSGATGLSAAIVAIDSGASVIVVEANYDVGGHAIMSGGNTPLGGGTSAQKKYGIVRLDYDHGCGVIWPAISQRPYIWFACIRSWNAAWI